MSKLEQLKNAKSFNEFAKLLGYQPKALAYIIYKIPDANKYTEFSIKKKNGGLRTIKAPTDKLKKAQRRLADLLNDCYEEINKTKKPISTGFRKDCDITINAKSHKNKRFVFNIDLSDFFPSINFGRVRGYFIKDRNFLLDEKIATIIAQIACFNNELPQGSPCSPVISNLLCHILDIRIVKIASKYSCYYTRYADDLTFSTNIKSFPKEIAFQKEDMEWEVGILLNKEILRAGYKVNPSKTNMQYKIARQMVTGLVVNKKVNIKQEYYKYARAYCHELFRNDEFYTTKKNNQLNNSKNEGIQNQIEVNRIKGTLNQLEGILSFIYQVKKININQDLEEFNFSEDFYKNVKKKKSKEGINKLYQNFLAYKNFINNDKPLIICEGKTDIVYLKCALKSLKDQYPEMISFLNERWKFSFNFLHFTDNFKAVFDFSEGFTGLNDLINNYLEFIKPIKSKPKQPVIILLDTDGAFTRLTNKVKNKSEKESFCYYNQNLYIVFVNNYLKKEIEDLFDEELRMKIIDGKKFNPKKAHKSPNEYGKHIFAEKVIKPNWEQINFERFSLIFDRILAVQKDYFEKINQLSANE